MVGCKSPSLVLMTRSSPWATLETLRPASATDARKSSSLPALLEIWARPAAAWSIAFKVSPALSKALVAAASALDGSGATSPAMTGARAGILLVAREPWAGSRHHIDRDVADQRAVQRGTVPSWSLYRRSSARVTITPSGSLGVRRR